MNIVHLIGNGFDLNLGMKTRYTDFYDYYLSQISDNETINDLKNKIQSNYKNWSDLELGLGNYLNNLDQEGKFNILFEDLLDTLGRYLEKEDESFDFSTFDKEKFYTYLSKPEQSLPKADFNEINKFKNINWSTQTWNVRIITFNYTRSLEKILNYDTSNILLGMHHNRNIELKSIEHLHGFVDERIPD